jgi:CubicO group peptidase (beta-lactamase class C family)
VVAEWGDTRRVDMTFSVTKSFLSTVVGLAVDRGMIASVHDPVHPYVGPIFPLRPGTLEVEANAPLPLFGDERERRITWDHLLRQTSDWEGMLWCKPDWSDRAFDDPSERMTRERHEPGTVYQYNDVRVNLLALAALNLWRRPLPEVLREEVMDPIGASPSWRWYGYENSWVVMDGAMVQSVSGGAHWGGGLFISARDLARFGYLHLRDGRWGDRQILSEEWLRMARAPGQANRRYGFMIYFLNIDRETLPAAPESAHYHAGAGANIVYVDPVHDLVDVARWIQSQRHGDFIERILASLDPVTEG